MEITNRIRLNVGRDVECSLKHELLDGRHLPHPWLYHPDLVPASDPPNGFSSAPQAWMLIVDGAVRRLRLMGYPVTLDQMPPDVAARLVVQPIKNTARTLRENVRDNLQRL